MTRTRTRNERATVLLLCGVGATDAAGYGVVTPTLPLVADLANVGPVGISALVTVFAAAQLLVGAPVGALAVARAGARPTVIAGLVVMSLGATLFAAGDSYPTLLAARGVQGVGAGLVWLGLVFAVLEGFGARVPTVLASVVASYGIGAIAGPALGGVGGLDAPFLAYAAICAVLGVVATRLDSAQALPRFRAPAKSSPTPGVAMVGAFAAGAGLGVLDGPLALHLGTRLDQAPLAACLAGVAVLVAVSSLAAGRLDPRRTVAAGVVMIALGIAAVSATAEPVAWLPLLAVAGAGLGATETGALLLLVRGPWEAGLAGAVMLWTQLFGVGLTVAPLVAGLLVQEAGFAAVGLLPAAIAAVLLATLVRTASTRPAFRR